jgi:hypothetical protein
VDSLGGDPDARLIATAITAHHEDSVFREEYGLYQRPGSGRLVGIVMRGAWPTFFRIDLPNQIENKVLEPEFDTLIIRKPPFGDRNRTGLSARCSAPQQRLKEEMKPLDNRKLLVDEFLRLKKWMLRTSGKRE